MPSERKRTELQTWTIQVKLPPDVVNPGRYMARVLKALLRQYRVRCIALKDGLPSERVES